MPKAPLPPDEADRLADLRSYAVLDTPAEAAFDDLVRLAAAITRTPVSLVSLVDADRQWFKASVGFDRPETARDAAFCAHTILGTDVMEVPDATRNPRFANSPLVTGDDHVRFYAGMPLVTPEGHAVGSLCVIDTVPRRLTGEQTEALRVLGRQVVDQLRLRRSVARLASSEQFARSTIDALAVRLAVLDEAGRVMAVNKGWREASDLPDGGVGLDYLFACGADGGPTDVCGGGDGPADPADGAALVAGLRSLLAGRAELFTMEYAHAAAPTAPDRPRWSQVRATRFDDGGQPRLVVCHKDVTDRRAAVDRLQHDAHHDGLTGLPNRVAFAEAVDRCLALARRRPHPFAVLMLDLDRFKLVNDSLGHAAGDRLLTTVAGRLRTAVRPTDTVARMGGDEFTILLEQLTGAEDAARVAERVRTAVSQPVLDADGQELLTAASIGIVACCPGESAADAAARYDSAKGLLRDADAALYKAKAAGKDRYAVFDTTMHAEVVARMKLEADLRRAVDRGELELHYQPICKLGPAGRHAGTAGFEALVRWRRGGVLVSPADFIPVAEDTGIIVPIGTWVLRQACQQLATWRAAGGPLADLYVTVNVSRRQLADPTWVATVADVLRAAGVPPAAVTLEITESAIMDDPAAAERTLLALRNEVGVRLSVDDFGTGYSSLACLRRFPIDLLKIDRSFVRNVAGDRRDAAVMRTIVSLAHALEMRVVAEGIEQPAQAAFLSGAACDLTQGYLFSRPLPPAAAERFVRDAAAGRAAA